LEGSLLPFPEVSLSSVPVENSLQDNREIKENKNRAIFIVMNDFLKYNRTNVILI
jgi:hypothetical protein